MLVYIKSRFNLSIAFLIVVVGISYGALCNASYASERHMTSVINLTQAVDTVLTPAVSTTSSGTAPSLYMGQGGGYADDANQLIRFDNLPKISDRDIISVRLGLYREWRANVLDDADEIVKLVLPAPQAFSVETETWESAANRPIPNNAIRDFNIGTLANIPKAILRITVNKSAAGAYKYADITGIARGWFEGTRPNTGLLLVTDYAQSSPWIGDAYMTSSEGPEGQRPVLEITYAIRPENTGDGRWAIIEADGSTEAEKTAATELRNYLRVICGEWFEIEPESTYTGNRPAIYVGATKYAKKSGCRVEAFTGDEFVMKRVGGNLILCGGAPRGTLYAVTQFLEEYCGVRWLTLFGEEYVPNNSKLALPRINRRVKPSFTDRDLMVPRYWPPTGWYDNKSFETLGRALAFGRINGKASPIHLGGDLLPKHYGARIWGNHVAHTLRWYLAPDKYFAEHPEFYALKDGKRIDSGLCKSNPEMRDVYFKNITEIIKKAEADGYDTFVFHISDEDGGIQPCQCTECVKLDKLYGGNNVGQMLAFVNYLAERGRGIWPPNMKIETLAYGSYETPPAVGKIDDDVIVRYAPIFKHHWDPLDSSVNTRDLRNLQGWRKLASDVRIWDYPHQYGSGAEPVSGLSITEPRDKALKDWVARAVKDTSSASAGLHLSLLDPVSPTERHVFAARISAFWEPQRSLRPKLIVKWKIAGSSKKNTTVLSDSAVAIADSEKTMRYVYEPGNERIGGMQLSGVWGQTDGHRTYSYLRFDFQSIPKNAQILDAELILCRFAVRGTDQEARIAFRAVKPGQHWDPLQLTWDNQPQVEDKALFTMRLAPPVPGYVGYDGLFPQPNLRTLVHNIQIYKKLGVKGVFMETDATGLTSGLHCEADLTYWVLMQALWNPDRSADDLINDFCKHYYGPGAKYIEKYVRVIEDSYKEDPYKQAFHVGFYSLQNYLNYNTVYRCQALFDQAEKACVGDTNTISRIRLARLSIDIATLFNLEKLQAEYKQLKGSLNGFVFDRQQIEKRYTESRLTKTRQRFPSRDLDEEKKDIDKLLDASRKAGVWSLWRTLPPINSL